MVPAKHTVEYQHAALADPQPFRRAAGSVENSRTTLEFAKNAKKLTMRPQLNEVRDEQAIIRTMAAEIQELRKKLVSWAVRRPGHLVSQCQLRCHVACMLNKRRGGCPQRR